MKYYEDQVRLLIRCLPAIAAIDLFALKGGTAINLFVREDLPRLSVDIDLIYLPIQGRGESLQGIEAGLLAIQKKLTHLNSKVKAHKNIQTQTITSLTVAQDLVKIKIEPNLILRGTVYPVNKLDLSKTVVDRYGLSVLDMPVAAIPDLYGGKICAALDRQHPRDLFDLQHLLAQGISESIKKAFLVYLVSHNRPIHELLQPNRLDLSQLYKEEFLGMANEEVAYETLITTRENLIATINNMLTIEDKRFLLAIKQGIVASDLIGLSGIEKLSGIQWKLINIEKMNKEAKLRALKKLSAVLNLEYSDRELNN